jgi:hypothetical protein
MGYMFESKFCQPQTSSKDVLSQGYFFSGLATMKNQIISGER